MIDAQIPTKALPGTASELRRSLIAAVVVFGVATLLAVVAQQLGRPITAAITYLFGATLLGGLLGLRGGLAAALATCLTYNFFISDPVFRFDLSSAEAYVPLIAFNISAAVSAILAGRLRDRARAAELASRQLQALLEASQQLQGAARIEDVPTALAQSSAGQTFSFELYVVRDQQLIALQETQSAYAHAVRVMESGSDGLATADFRLHALRTSERLLGILAMRLSRELSHDQGIIDGIANLLSLTFERCMLLEQLSQADLVRRSEEFKTALLSSVSHDLRTPLSVISASASSLASYGDELSSEARADILSTMQDHCSRLDRYTANLLHLSRLQAGLHELRLIPCDALDVIGAALARLRGAAAEPRVIKAYALQSPMVDADPVMLEQAFYNVLENAIRYSPAGSPIRLGAEQHGESLTITIRDEGPGIPQADLHRVFERFYRCSDTPAEGSGLGLSIAKGFIEAFGGEIEAEAASDLEGGTVVIIKLPMSTNTVASA